MFGEKMPVILGERRQIKTEMRHSGWYHSLWLACILLLFTLSPVILRAQKDKKKENGIFLADPTIFYYDHTYYLYGTSGSNNNGFVVYTSSDLKHWTGPAGTDSGYVLKKGRSFGSNKFWAPQVFEHNKRFYMAYAASEQVAIAMSEDPLGPFTQDTLLPVSEGTKQIDPFVFRDADGRNYLYYVEVANGGNRIYVSEMNADLLTVKNGSRRFCLEATQPWENTEKDEWSVTEGPTVFRHKGLYYMLYSANHFKSPNYAVGYAVSSDPLGPWEKSGGGPFLSKSVTGHNGSGHGDLFSPEKGKWFYVFHTHYSNEKVSPRRTALIKLKFKKDRRTGRDKPVVKRSGFRFLRLKN